jgi:hypothetical protein
MNSAKMTGQSEGISVVVISSCLALSFSIQSTQSKRFLRPGTRWHPCLALQGFRGGRRRHDSVAIGLESGSLKISAALVLIIWYLRFLPGERIIGTSRFKPYLDLLVPQHSTTLAIRPHKPVPANPVRVDLLYPEVPYELMNMPEQRQSQ